MTKGCNSYKKRDNILILIAKTFASSFFSRRSNSIKFYSGFTLAEVLIVLGVIGIVAAMTVPNLMTQIEKKRNLAVLKLAYTKLHSYVKDFDRDMGCEGDFANCFPGDGEFAVNFARYLVKNKGFVDTVPHGDWYGKLFDYKNSQFYYESKAIDNDNLPKDIVAPGGAYKYTILKNMYDNYYNINGDRTRAMVIIHVNSGKFAIDRKREYNFSDTSKKRNVLGRDTFKVFIFNSERVIPGGAQYCQKGAYYCTYWKKNNSCSPDLNSTASGEGCFGRIIDEGWQINYW